jgi:hypothetical protein
MLYLTVGWSELLVYGFGFVGPILFGYINLFFYAEKSPV